MGNSRWNSIPNEILRLILVEIESSLGFQHCLQVNKQWFAMGKPILYKHLTIRQFRKGNRLVDTLTKPNSNQYCQFVKKITFQQSFKVPMKNLDLLDPSQDILHLLMDNTPHVEEINISRMNDDHEREYLVVALKRIHKWKLHVIPSPNIFSSMDQYNSFAHLMESSLTELVVKRCEVDGNYYDYLKNYPKLKSVQVEFNRPATISDCLDVIHSVPLLEDLQVEFLNKKIEVGDKDWNADMLDDAEPYSNIKKLWFIGFQPSNGKEILFIKDKFTDILDISIESMQHYWLGEDQSSSEAISMFFKYVQAIPKYSINITHLHINKFEFLKKYLDMFGTTTDTFILKFDDNSDHKSALKFSSGNQVFLTMGYNQYLENVHCRDTKEVLKIVGNRLQTVKFMYPGQADTINKYLNIVLESSCRSCLQRLSFYKGTLRCEDQHVLDTTTTTQPISELVLRRVKISPSALLYVSGMFPYLKKMKLEGCQFLGYLHLFSHLESDDSDDSSGDDSEDDSEDSSGDDERVDPIYTTAQTYMFDISMIYTELELLELKSLRRYNLQVAGGLSIFVKVTSLKNAITVSYFIVHENGKNVSKVTQAEFISAKKGFQEGGMLMICLNVQSITAFVFSAPGYLTFRLDL